MATDDLIRIQQAHHRRLLGLQDATANLIARAWDTFAGLDDAAAVAFEASATVIMDAARVQTATLATAYMEANDRAGGFPTARLQPEVPPIRGGVPTSEVYHRSIIEARRLISRGASFDQASAAGRARATGTARTDVSLTNKETIDAGGALRPHVVGYRRVLTGKSCAFCAVASTQRYRRASLMPLHPRCDCDVAEIVGTTDPGRVINRGLLQRVRAAEDGGTAPYVVDEQGAIRDLKAGDKVSAKVIEHTEIGPMLVARSKP